MELIVRRGHPRVMAASYGPRVWLALATIYVVWGSTFMAVTIAVRDVPPLLAMGIRHVTAGTLLLASPCRAETGEAIASAGRRSGPASSSAAPSSCSGMAALRGRSRPSLPEWRPS